MSHIKSIHNIDKGGASNSFLLTSIQKSCKMALIGALLLKGPNVNSQVYLGGDINLVKNEIGLDIKPKEQIDSVYKMKNLDSLSHDEIIRYPISVMIKYHDLNKTQEIVQDHMLIEINKLRKGFRHKLTIDSNLTNTAVLYAQALSIEKRKSHFSKDGSNWTIRARESGYTGSYVGEVLGYDFYSIAAAIDGWENSKGHFEEIKNRKRKSMGFGISPDGNTIVIVFGSE